MRGEFVLNLFKKDIRCLRSRFGLRSIELYHACRMRWCSFRRSLSESLFKDSHFVRKFRSEEISELLNLENSENFEKKAKSFVVQSFESLSLEPI